MAFKDLLLSLTSYPDPSAPAAIAAGVGYAALLEARITAVTFEIEIPMPMGFYADRLVDLSGLIATERQKSATQARELVAAFEAEAAARGLAHEARVAPANTVQTPALIRDHARLSDLAILPLGPTPDFRNIVAETVIFEAGRPVLVVPEAAGRAPALDHVVLAWDFGRPAARALADALPLLRRAGRVEVVAVETGGPAASSRTGDDLLRHIAHHGVAGTFTTIPMGDRTVAEALSGHALAAGADLLVMGAYGHSRLRDFMLGGATKAMLAAPPLPLFLSH
ncbi:universal stress protein [Salinarimonas soli]|nr:universal stress protein [Salinarimonas soli]